MVLGIISIIVGFVVITAGFCVEAQYIMQQTLGFLYIMCGSIFIIGGLICITVEQTGNRITEQLKTKEKKTELPVEQEQKVELKQEETTEEPPVVIDMSNLQELIKPEDFKRMSDEDKETYKSKINDLIANEENHAVKQKYYEQLVAYGYLYYTRFID